VSSKRKRLLVVGGGYADIPLILSAKNLGYHVITTGYFPSELGHHYSDEYHKADYSDPDAILGLAQKLGIDAICACCNDFSALSCAYVAEKLGLSGHDPYEVSMSIHHKDLYRQFALRNNISSPLAFGFTRREEAIENLNLLSFPIIVKPVDLTGGKGVSTVYTVEQAKSAIEKAFTVSRSKRIVIEEFIEGSRHGFSAFLRNGRVVFFFSDNEHYFKNPYLVSAASAPSIVSPTVEKKLCVESERIAQILSLKTGIFHIQYILRNDEPVIIEICRRAPGDLYVKLVEHATGLLYSEWIVKASAGLDCSELSHSPVKGFFTRHCVMSARAGKVNNVIFDSSIQENIIDQFMWWKRGDIIQDEMVSKLGIVFLRFSSIEEMLEKTELMPTLIRVDVK